METSKWLGKVESSKIYCRNKQVMDTLTKKIQNSGWVSLTIFRPPSHFPSDISGGIGLPKNSQGVSLTIFGPKWPEIGAEGAVLEKFWQILAKVPKIPITINFAKNFGLEKFFRVPLVNCPKNGFRTISQFKNVTTLFWSDPPN